MASGKDNFDKQWWVRSVQGATPAAGQELSITVPSGVVWKIKSIFFQLVTNSTVATRITVLQITDGTNIVFRSMISGAGQAASLTGNYTWAPGQLVPGTANVASYQAAIPQDLVLLPGFVISTATISLQTGDQYGTLSLLVEQGDAGA